MVTGSRIVSPLAMVRKSNIPALSRKSSIPCEMSGAAKVRRVCPEAGFPFAEVHYFSSGEGLFRRGVVGYIGHGYGACFAAFRISTGGKWVVGVFLEKDFDSY